MRFQDPIWLAAIVPIVLAAIWSARRRRRYAVVYSSLQGMKDLPVTWAQRIRRLLPALWVLGLCGLAIALARPQEGLDEFRIRTEGIAIEMAIDRSGSMQAMDFEEEGERVNRLHVVKRVFRDFVKGRPDDRIGLLVFGGFAESRCPLTLDHGALLQIVDQVEIPEPLRGAGGRVVDQDFLQEELSTAVGDAIVLGIERLKDAPAKSKVLILLSDGESNAGIVDPEQAAEVAKTFGIKVYTIGVGSTGTAPFPGKDLFGKPALVARKVHLDEKSLKQIAETTGGRYFNAKTTAALEEVYRSIDELEKTETEGRLYTEYLERFPLPLILGALCLLLELALGSTRFLTLP